ncbi:MAG TPA: hypothetical protein VH392_08765, partial [Sphingomicrobium sp.]
MHDALAEFPDDPDVLTLMAWALEEDGRPEESTPFLRRAAVADPGPERRLALASHLRRYVGPEFAIEELEALPRAVRTRGQVGLLYADALGHVGKHVEQIATYREMLELEPSNPAIWVSFGSALLSANQTEEAVSAMK